MSASNSVLGVSVGASAVHMARPAATNGSSTARTGTQRFDLQSVEVAEHPAERLTAEIIGVALASGQSIEATAVACRAESQAEALHTAMAREKLDNYELVPELFASLEWLDKTGMIDGYRRIAIYDLGSAGLTVSVLDVESRAVLSTRRLELISGSYFDSLIAQQQIDAGLVAMPGDAAGFAELDALCRDAKEQLSTSTAVALPASEGLVLLSRENFEDLIMVPLEDSAREVREVVTSADKPVDAVVVVGGGARIPLVAAVLERWTNLPVVVPDEPEAVAARGAALLARPIPTSRRGARPAGHLTPIASVAAGLSRRRRRELSGAGLAVGALVVIAVIGLGLGFGPKLVGGDSGAGNSVTTVPAAPTTDAVAPIASSVPAPPPAPPPAPAVAPAPAPVEEQAPVVQQAPAVQQAPQTRNAPVEPAAPPPPPAPAPAPAPVPGPNTITVPGLPPIVLPPIPPGLLPPLPPLPGQ